MTTQAKSWPFQEARSLLKHIEKKGKKPGDVVTFETGYGPSGAPHIGTFAEVVRTLWVMKAFDTLTDKAYQTRLIMFSDDYDAMRKVPDGMPAWMQDYLGKPLSTVPNPYPEMDECVANDADQYAGSFAGANNDRLVRFVDDILKTYDGSVVGSSPDRSRVSFVSSSDYYRSGKFNEMLDRIWDNYDAIQGVMLPTLGEERRATYSPFMPLFEGRLLNEGVSREMVIPGRQLTWETGRDDVTAVTSPTGNGRSKLQWKVDWAMRWAHFDVDYEMSGKDLIDSVTASRKICRAIGGTPPVGMTYELFLDAEGKKISKSKGNGFSIEDWLSYGSKESLMLFLFQKPTASKPIHIDLVPKMEDDYLKMLGRPLTPNDAAWFFTENGIAEPIVDVAYSLLLNLSVVSQASDAETLVSYLEQSRPLDFQQRLQVLIKANKVIRYATERGLYDRECREPTVQEADAFIDLATRLEAMLPNMTADHYQYQVYEVGKAHGFEPLRSWFQALYECLLGSSDGPRFGAFIEAYGLENCINILRIRAGVLIEEEEIV